MGPERIELSARERERLKILQQVEEGHLKQVEAARRLRLSDRQVRLQARLRAEGDGGIVHRLRGRGSNRKIPESLTQRAVRQLRQARYVGFGPTLAAEHLAAGHERQPRNAAEMDERSGIVAAAKSAAETVHVWRPRRSAFGELVMMDSSPYGWLEERGPACHSAINNSECIVNALTERSEGFREKRFWDGNLLILPTTSRSAA